MGNPEVVTDDGKVTIKVISGRSHGVESVKELAYTPINYYYYKVKAGGEFKQELQPGFNYFLYVLNGRNLVLNEDTKVDRYQNVFSATKVISSLVRMLLQKIITKPKYNSY